VKELPLRVDRDGELPIYLQLKKQIEQLIRTGYWREGMRIPTERDLANALGISRNTVSMAYRELEAQGFVTSRQGRGTFILSGISKNEDGAERLKRAIESCIDEALFVGLGLDDFLAMVHQRVEERRELLGHVKAAFVECNKEQLDYFAKQLELGSGVKIVPLLFPELKRDMVNARAVLGSMDVIVTTFFHLDEVREMASGTGVDVLGIALDPLLETMVRIARIGDGKRVGLVCSSKDFAERVMKSLSQSGISTAFEYTITKDRQELEKFVRPLHVVITSPGRKKEVEACASPGAEIIEFIYRPDAGSINLLKTALIERRPG